MDGSLRKPSVGQDGLGSGSGGGGKEAGAMGNKRRRGSGSGSIDADGEDERDRYVPRSCSPLASDTAHAKDARAKGIV